MTARTPSILNISIFTSVSAFSAMNNTRIFNQLIDRGAGSRPPTNLTLMAFPLALDKPS